MKPVSKKTIEKAVEHSVKKYHKTFKALEDFDKGKTNNKCKHAKNVICTHCYKDEPTIDKKKRNQCLECANKDKEVSKNIIKEFGKKWG